MINLLCIIIAVLCIIILILSVTIFKVVKKATYLSKKERDMAVFAIDMYIEYGEEIGITPEKDKHDLIISELGKLKNKINGKG